MKNAIGKKNGKPSLFPSTLFVGASLLALLVAVPVTLNLVQNQQDIRQEAAKKKKGKVVSQIASGTPVAQGEYSFAGALLDTSYGKTELQQQICGLSLLDSQHALTAGHCVSSNKSAWSRYRVALGLTTLGTKQGQRRKVKNIQIMPRFSNNSINSPDVAVLTFDQPITAISPVNLPVDSSFATVGTSLVVLGWGNTTQQIVGEKNKKPRYSRVLLKAGVTTIACNSQNVPTAIPLCTAASDGSGACDGDSGGPLIHVGSNRITQIGIIAIGNGCGDPSQKNVSMNLSSPEVKNFIKTALSQ